MSLFKKIIHKKKFVDLYASLKNKEELKDDGPITVTWLNERLSGSCRACRFELPMDMKSLEKMTAVEYLLKFCKISRPRMNIYKKVYYKYRNKNTNLMDMKDLETTVCSLLVDTVGVEDIHKLTQTLRLDSKQLKTVELNLFAVVCAVAERICYLSYIRRWGVLCGLGRDYLECADFSALNWKLRNVEIDPNLKRILYSIG